MSYFPTIVSAKRMTILIRDKATPRQDKDMIKTSNLSAIVSPKRMAILNVRSSFRLPGEKGELVILWV